MSLEITKTNRGQFRVWDTDAFETLGLFDTQEMAVDATAPNCNCGECEYEFRADIALEGDETECPNCGSTDIEIDEP